MNTDEVKTGKLEVIPMVHCQSIVDTIDLAKHAVSYNVRALLIMGDGF